jgi:hypothetical protein
MVLGRACVWAIKWGGLRHSGLVTWDPARWALGWAPSFLAAFTLPYLWPALGRRLLGRVTRFDFLPECSAAAILFMAGEILDGLVPRWGNTSPQTFDPLDLAAAPAGALCAFLLNRTISVLTHLR